MVGRTKLESEENGSHRSELLGGDGAISVLVE